MKIPPVVKQVANFIFDKYSKDVGGALIYTAIIGWIASSTAQILGIALNKKYTKEQKSFMIPQEVGDALINIGSFFLITTPLKKMATKLATTGKIVPKIVKDVAVMNGDAANLGKLTFNITKQPYFVESVEKTFNSFHNFMSTSAAVGGAILSSNIITPILRNRFAARGQKDIIKIADNLSATNAAFNNSRPMTPIRKPSTFDMMRQGSLKI